MNKNISKKILIKPVQSYDKSYESKKSSKSHINFQDFLKDYFKDSDTSNLSKYIK